jgi:hypothetical protein
MDESSAFSLFISTFAAASEAPPGLGRRESVLDFAALPFIPALFYRRIYTRVRVVFKKMRPFQQAFGLVFALTDAAVTTA